MFTLSVNNDYNYGFHNIFSYNHFTYSDYLLYIVTAIGLTLYANEHLGHYCSCENKRPI